MTSEDRKLLHRELWLWLAKNPESKKTDWPLWKKYELLDPIAFSNTCFACSEAVKRSSYEQEICDYCPLTWGTKRCAIGPTDFDTWRRSKDMEQRVECALKIANMEWRGGDK